MAEVPLLRIDERLIHGQVVAGFLRSLSCNRVIIIDDGVRNDKFMKKILEMAMPPSAKLTVYSCAEATESWRKDQFGPGRAIENAINKSNKGKSLVTLIFLSQSEVKKP